MSVSRFKQNKQFRILVVDDDKETRWQLMRMFMRAGAACEIAENGEKAVALIAKMQFDAVVTDLKMPGKHGHWLATELLQKKSGPLVYIITGIADEKIIKDLILKGVEDLVTKPFDVHLYVVKILAHLERREIRLKLKNETDESREYVPVEQIDSVASELSEEETDLERKKTGT